MGGGGLEGRVKEGGWEGKKLGSRVRQDKEQDSRFHVAARMKKLERGLTVII